MLVDALLLLFAGTLIGASAAVVILTPILLPVVLSMGIDPLFFGVMMAVNLAIGCIISPVGLDLFVVSAVTKIPTEKVTREMMPYLGVLLLDLLRITYFQDIILIVLRAFGG